MTKRLLLALAILMTAFMALVAPASAARPEPTVSVTGVTQIAAPPGTCQLSVSYATAGFRDKGAWAATALVYNPSGYPVGVGGDLDASRNGKLLKTGTTNVQFVDGTTVGSVRVLLQLDGTYVQVTDFYAYSFVCSASS